MEMQMQRKAVVSKLLASQNTSNQKQPAADCKNQYKGKILVANFLFDGVEKQETYFCFKFNNASLGIRKIT